MIVGHDAARRELENALPPAAMLLGPPSIGKRTLIGHLLRHHKVAPYDQFSPPSPLTVDAVRATRAVTTRAPFGAYRAVVLDLHQASDAAQSALLKVLEEPPPTVRFLLRATPQSALPTVISRCQLYRLGALSTREVEQVLLGLGLPAKRAALAAGLSGGRIRAALAAERRDNEQRANVVSVMRSIAVGDRDGFHRAFLTWDPEATELLSTWFAEAIAQHWSTFSAEETFGLHHNRDRLLAMVAAMSTVAGARPRLQARAALEPFIGR